MEKLARRQTDWNVPVETDGGSLTAVVPTMDEADSSVANFVFESPLEYAYYHRVDGGSLRYYFRTAESRVLLPFSPAGIDKVMSAVGGEMVRTASGIFVGWPWTFVNNGGYVSCVPLDAKTAAKCGLSQYADPGN